VKNTSLMSFQGAEGKQLLIVALRAQALIRDEQVAIEVAKIVKLEMVPRGTTLIRQAESDTDLYLILKGEFSVEVDGHVMAVRTGGDHLGEMTVVNPGARRSATVVAVSDSVVARISEPEFSALADSFPHIWRRIASELANRLRARDATSFKGQERDPLLNSGKCA
jgi:CRP/FNR family cyclic AMP-dependent transcriptional regulator